MHAKAFVAFVLSVAASAVLGSPHVGARDATTTTDSDVFTGTITSKPAYTQGFKGPTLSPELSKFLSEESALHSLPSSILSVLSTAAPSGLNVADGCVLGGSKKPDWFNKLPSSVQSYLTSYQSGITSFYSEIGRAHV